MKAISGILLILTLMSSLSWAQETPIVNEDTDILEASEPEAPLYNMKEIKTYVLSQDPEHTCMDQYLKRRRQVILQLSLTPLIVPAAFISGGVGGMFAGSFTYTLLYRWFGILTSANGGWDQLGYLIGGGVIGAAGTTVYALTNGGFRVSELIDHNRMLKSLMELHHNQIGPVTEYLYSRFMKQNPQSPLGLSAFAESLKQFDAEGRLCDGSLKRKRSRLFPNSLKNKLTRSKDLFHHLKD